MSNPVSDERENIELTRKKHAEHIRSAMKRYESLRPLLEQHRGEYIAISVKTLDYVTAPDRIALQNFASLLRADDFVWVDRVS